MKEAGGGGGGWLMPAIGLVMVAVALQMAEVMDVWDLLQALLGF